MRVFVPALLLLLLLTLPTARAQAAAVTRGSFLNALWEHAGAVPYDATPVFSDVEREDPWATAVGWAAAQGLVQGTGSGRFEPDRPITREEAALVLCRWAQLQGREIRSTEGAGHMDAADLSPWSEGALPWAVETGLLEPVAGGRLDPSGSLEQREVDALFQRMAAGVGG